jgi:hypothetical protein
LGLNLHVAQAKERFIDFRRLSLKWRTTTRRVEQTRPIAISGKLHLRPKITAAEQADESHIVIYLAVAVK